MKTSQKPPKQHLKQHIRVAVDNCIFTVHNGVLQVLLIQMKKQPFTGMWALPGGLVANTENLEAAATRILEQITGMSKVYLAQLATFGEVRRDPFGRVISVAYYALIPPTGVALRMREKYSAIKWWPFEQLPKKLAYDHSHIAAVARERLQSKLSYTNVVWSLLPEIFRLTELQKAYEAVLGSKLDKRNFRKKLLSLGLIEPVGRKTQGSAHRPAMLYRFRSKTYKVVSILGKP